MELRHLRYFVAVAEEENVSRAALRLHLSQPALSRQIRDLEEDIGFLLLERSAKSVRLTEAGRIFLGDARAVLKGAEDAVKAARRVALGARAELHVGYAPSLTVRLLPEILRGLKAEQPNVRVVLHDLSTAEMLSQLRSGALQIALLVRPTRALLGGLRFEALLRDPNRLAVMPGHPLARRRSVAMADAIREPFVVFSRRDYPEYHGYLASLFGATEGSLRVAQECDSLASLMAAVESGAGVAVVPGSVADLAGSRLKLLPLSPAPEALVIGAAWARLEGAAAFFLARARETALSFSPGRR